MPELTPSTAVLQTLASQEGGAVKSRGHTSHDLWYAEAPVGSCVALMWLHRLSACIRTGKRSFLKAPQSALFQFIEAIGELHTARKSNVSNLSNDPMHCGNVLVGLNNWSKESRMAIKLQLEKTNPNSAIGWGNGYADLGSDRLRCRRRWPAHGKEGWKLNPDLPGLWGLKKLKKQDST